MHLQISEFEVNICTCKVTSSESLPSFKPYKQNAAQAGSGANFYSKNVAYHLKGDPQKSIDVRTHCCSPCPTPNIGRSLAALCQVDDLCDVCVHAARLPGCSLRHSACTTTC
jgi:hypothetical protein